MVGAAVSLPRGRDEIEASEGVSLRDQIVAAMAILDDARSRASIAGIHDHASRRFDPIPESLLPITVLHQEGLHGDVAVFIDVVGFDFMDVYLITGQVGALKAGATNHNVLAVGGE